jgi:acetyl-CoA carboxylase carboxyltransferase component
MEVIASRVNTESPGYQANHRAGTARVDRLLGELRASTEGGGKKYTDRHHERGKLLPRERIELLLDEGSYFLELGALAGYGMENEACGAGIVGGIGRVGGSEALVIANEATVKGGAISEIGVRKLARLAEVASQNELPSIYLVESAGADLPQQSRIFIPGGAEFREITRRSKKRLPTIAVVFGNSTAGGAYIPGLSDYVILVEDQAKVFLGGPPLVKMATGEVTDEESLGGARMHTQVSGVGDYLARDEREGLRLARELAEFIGRARALREPRGMPGPAEPPRFSADELLGIVPEDPRVPFDCREVIARTVDGSRFLEFKPDYGGTLVTGFAYLQGYPIGILGNNGVLTSEAAGKGAQFIQLCNQQSVALLFLQNVTGFMVGREAEQGGIIRNGAKLVNAVANSEVPAITLMIGSSFGAGNYAMCGRAYQPRFLFTWPNHRIGVMGGKQLAGVLDIIKREAAAREGRNIDEKELDRLRSGIESRMDEESDAYFATARLWDDGILDPRQTREVLGIACAIVHRGDWQGSVSWGVFRH